MAQWGYNGYMEKKCPCGNTIKVIPSLIKRKKYCSKKCFYKYRKVSIWNKGLKGIHLSPKSEFKKGVRANPAGEFKKGHKPVKPIQKGERRGIATEFTTERSKGENNNKWKGNKVGYGATHSWIYRHYGYATCCENRELEVLLFNCNGISNKYEWAFKHKKGHARDRKQYYQLCHSCHIKYDRS